MTGGTCLTLNSSSLEKDLVCALVFIQYILRCEVAPRLDLRPRPSSSGGLGTRACVGERMPEMDSSGKRRNLYAEGLRSAACGSRRE